MNANQITLIQGTWSRVLQTSDEAAEVFYARLLEIDPSIKILFHGDMKTQGRKLILMITASVNSLNDISRLLPMVQELGRRHTGYGVRDSHYGSVGSALLWTLEQILGDAFTPEAKIAWRETFLLLAGVMKDSAAKTANAA